MDLLWIIDDDPILVFVAKRMLQMFGSVDKIEHFENGKVGLLELQKRVGRNEQVPKVILLDINMPVMNGWEFLEKIKEKNQFDKFTIFIFSSSTSSVDQNKATEYNVRFIKKPLDETKIKEILSVN